MVAVVDVDGFVEDDVGIATGLGADVLVDATGCVVIVGVVDEVVGVASGGGTKDDDDDWASKALEPEMTVSLLPSHGGRHRGHLRASSEFSGTSFISLPQISVIFPVL